MKSQTPLTPIGSFDPHFNAITGLNGSGKSNILDAVCFVLGITNLSQVRAGSLTELIYKQGQAGVTKATVTLVFDNSDTPSSPVGYESCPQITVTRQVLLGGKSKYTINGRTAPAGQVQNLFGSVQLNVNNPHFLIMQGRITKVLNMKAPEILGLVEEAAGTRLYETKRVAALKTIDKKELKLQELNNVLNQEITPTLERLRSEKQTYLQWTKAQTEVERGTRFVTAYDYWRAEQLIQQGPTAALEQEAQTLLEQQEQLDERVQEQQAEIQEQTQALQGDERLAQTQARETELSKKLVQTTSLYTCHQQNVQKAEKEVADAEQVVEAARQAVVDKEQEMTDYATSIATIRDEAEQAEARLEQLTQQYEDMAAGVGDLTLPEQIAQAHAASEHAKAKVKQAETKVQHLEKQLKACEKDLQKEGKAAEKMGQQRATAADKVKAYQTQVDALQFSEETFDALEQEHATLEMRLSELQEQADTYTAKIEGRLAFNYTDPVRGFDRTKVKGVVGKLFQIKDPKAATALEVAASNRLFHVVVDDSITGKALLDRGQLKHRVTIIPLDKIRSRQLSSAARNKASEVAAKYQSTAFPAIELVGFDEEIRSAMEHVFGTTLVIDGMRAAEQVGAATKTRTVTLDGDVFEPSGTITGGSRSGLGDILTILSELANVQGELDEKKPRLAEVVQELSAMKASSAQFDKLNKKLQLAQAELTNLEKHMSQTSVGMLLEKREEMTREIAAAKEEMEAMEKEHLEQFDLYNELKDREVELTQERENKLSGIKSSVKDAKADAVSKTQAAREVGSRSQTLSMELESLKADVEASLEALTAAKSALEALEEEGQQIQIDMGRVQQKYEDAKAALDKLNDEITSSTAELEAKKRALSDLKHESNEIKMKRTRMQSQIENHRKELDQAKGVLRKLLKDHSWIETEKHAFGVAGSDFDFNATDPKKAREHVQRLQDEQQSLSKKINKKVMGMIEKAEGEYTELQRKRQVVENDKKKIQEVIEELDVKKKQELDRTWVKVNGDFGSIFSTLLPGAKAKLEPPEGMEAWEGLEVKVAFGDTWKESLSELSGGQRSLLALSLILALLLFKPAPMYILDEVDAALDLSHTQNIGNMLKTHFSQSQFLVVSLKEGMFNNANVIFRTKFVEGVSTVTRTLGTNRPLVENEDRARSGKLRRGTTVGKENDTSMEA